MKRFTTILKRARLARGWTLEDVARRTGSHKGYISGIENGRVAPPGARLLLKLAEGYGLDGTELLLMALVEKAPKPVRGELRRRLFGVARRTSPKTAARRDREKVRRLVQKAERIGLLVEELLEELKGAV
jgi:transcriptional regulator with XRE-family HTH domain